MYDVRCTVRLQLQRVSKNNYITCVNGTVYDYGHSDYSSNYNRSKSMYFPRLFIDGADAAYFIKCFMSQEFTTIHFLSKAKT